MNKYAAFICASALAAALTACNHSSGSAENNGAEGSANQPREEAAASQEPLCGGWQQAASPEITAEIKEVCDKAFKNADGVSYTPVAYLAGQVVAGTNYAVLCRACPIAPQSTETYAVVKIFRSLKNECKITEVIDSGIPTNIRSERNLVGGWQQADSPVITEELRSMFAGAFKPPADAAYRPLALLSTQVVSGMNYCFFCEKTPDPHPSSGSYTFVWLYRDAQGRTEITDIEHFKTEDGK